MQPDSTNEVTQVDVGMTVVDATGEEAGTVSAVQLPGTDVRPDLAAGIAEGLMGTGYFRVEGTGVLANDTYGSAEQVEKVFDRVVTLRVTLGELYRTES